MDDFLLQDLQMSQRSLNISEKFKLYHSILIKDVIVQSHFL